MNFPQKIETERLLLEWPQNPTFDLAKDMYAVVEKSRDHLAPFLKWARTMNSAEEEFVYLKNYVEARFIEKTGFCYLIYLKDTHQFIGAIDLVKVDEKKKSTEIGFWLSQNATGQGYMVEAVKALETEAFAQGFNRIVIRNDTRNIKSANVAKNAGYHLDGVMRQDRFDEEEGLFCDTNVFSKLQSEASND